MENEEIEMGIVVVFKVIVIEKMVEMVEIIDEEVDLVIAVVHEKVMTIEDFRMCWVFSFGGAIQNSRKANASVII
jgi:hypothetical protein